MTAQGTIALAVARAWAGLPYIYAGVGPKGYDCSGLTMMAWRGAGVSLPRTSQEQAKIGTSIPLSQAQPGDLVLFSYPNEVGNPAPNNHVGLYVNPTTIWAASHQGVPIGFAPLDTAHFSEVIRPGNGIGNGSGATGAALTTGLSSANVQTDALQIAGYQATANLTPWGIPLNPLKLPGFLLGKLGGAAVDAGQGMIEGIVMALVSALGPLVLTATITIAGLGLVGLGVWGLMRPARQAATNAMQSAGSVAALAAV
jgi:hypothetical protein